MGLRPLTFAGKRHFIVRRSLPVDCRPLDGGSFLLEQQYGSYHKHGEQT